MTGLLGFVLRGGGLLGGLRGGGVLGHRERDPVLIEATVREMEPAESESEDRR